MNGLAAIETRTRIFRLICRKPAARTGGITGLPGTRSGALVESMGRR